MITKPTVLVLGAGASQPYGFPSGTKLVEVIVENLNPNMDRQERRIIKACGIRDETIDYFIEELRLSQQYSVDAFLEHRSGFREVGKLAITASLIPHEDEGWILKTMDRDSSFYQYLFSKMNTRFEDFHNNKLSIITFNYDRSIEHYLFCALLHTSGRSDEKCAGKMSRIPIIHVHGRLGLLPWQSEDGRPYQKSYTPEEIKDTSEQILVISEGKETSPEFEEARKLLKDAEYIYFLGFGFAEVNLKRLGIDQLPSRLAKPPRESNGNVLLTNMMGSSMNLGKAEASTIMDKWNIALPDTDNNKNCLSFLREYVEFR